MITDNYLNYYFKYLDNYPQLDKEREHILSKSILEGNEEESLSARNELILGNLSLVIYCAKRYYQIFNKLIPLQDLIEYGNLGLIDAASKFNYKKSVFSTFAYMRINAMISRGVDERDLIHKPAQQKYMLRVANRDYNSIEEYCEDKGISDKQMDRLNNNVDMKVVSISNMLDNGENFDIADNENITDNIKKNELLDILERCVNELKPKYRDLINRLYFKDMTEKEVGKEDNCTHQAVQNVKRRAMRLLRLKLLTIKNELI